MFAPSDGITVLYGKNGAGKTNLLEAIHLCCLGRSHRTSQDKELVMKGESQSLCQVKCDRLDGSHEVTVKLTPTEKKKKQIIINGKAAARIGEMMGHVTCVMFSPEDLGLVKDGPASRRKFMDMMISQLRPSYFYDLQKYMSALNQRNALLRELSFHPNPKKEGMLPIWEEQLAMFGGTIIEKRRQFTDGLCSLASENYRLVSGREKETFHVSYRGAVSKEDNPKEGLFKALELSRQDDLRRATTTIGPHRDDLTMTLTGRDMKVFASQGQIRTAALSLKLAELTMMEREHYEAPVLLLDDVMSELDLSRRELSLSRIKNVQTFVTCTDESDLAGAQAQRKIRVVLENDRGKLV